MQCGECLIWPRSLCRVRSGLRPTFGRGWPASRARLRGPGRRGSDALRTVPAGAARARGSGSAHRPSGRPAAARRVAARRVRSGRPGPRNAGNIVTRATFHASGAGSAFDAPTVIRIKRDGGVLSDEAIDWVIDAYTHGRIADEQMSALLMAIFLRGMTGPEIARWTSAMVASGERFDFTDLRRDGRPLALVDKHSTGGVGDKITIPLVPVVVAWVGAA